MRTVGAALAMVGMMAAAAPAEAREDRPRREAKRERPRDRGGDKVDAGDMALGALLLGGVLAIAGAGKKKWTPVGPINAAMTEPMGGGMPGAAPVLAVEEMTADDAADACGQAAESRGVKMARIAQVGTISSVERSGEAWLVSGTIALRDGYRDAVGRPGRFHCTLGTRDAPQVRFDGEPEQLASAN
jgi:hypothetical protein